MDAGEITTFIVSPLVVTAVGAVLGALLVGLAGLSQNRRALAVGGSLGAIAGVAGSALLTWPLGYCMFQEGQTNEDMIVGWILVFLGVGIAATLTNTLWQRRRRGLPLFPRADHVAGAFTGRWSALSAALVLSPTILILIFFIYVPMYDTLRLSTFLARFGAPRTRFICVSNFSRLLTDTDFHYNLVLSFVFAIGIIAIVMSTSLLIAVMANQPIRGAGIYRSLLIWPYAISPVVTGSIFGLMLGQESGIINFALDSTLGIKIPWLVTIPWAQISVVIASAWNIIGFNILFFLAGLQNIPKDVLEAASIDGANSTQRFWRVTFPLLAPFTFFLIVTNTIYAFFETFGLIFVLTRGGPTDSTFTAMFRVYVTGILGSDIGKSTAQSLVLFLIVVGITIVQFRFGNRRITYGNY